MSIGRSMDKEVWYILQKGILHSYKKSTFESVIMTWMKLEPIIQSEVSQKEKDKHHLSMHIYIYYIYIYIYGI